MGVGALGVVRRPSRRDGGPLFVEGYALEVLELLEGVLELGRDLVSLVLVLFLFACGLLVIARAPGVPRRGRNAGEVRD